MNVKAQLLELAEPSYQQFSSRLLPGTPDILGVRLPILRKMAKQIAKENWREFLNQNDDIYFEEIMLRGMVIGYIKDISIHEVMKHIQIFVPQINNWSVCDSFCSGLKITKQYQKQFWLLIYYVDNQYVTDVLRELDQVQHSGYYVRMAIAWAISACYVSYPHLTLSYLKQTQLDTFTYNKALQKISESMKSDIKTKELMKQMKRNEAD